MAVDKIRLEHAMYSAIDASQATFLHVLQGKASGF